MGNTLPSSKHTLLTVTPSKKQGLAPHYDDVDIFILQIEGKKHWKLYERTQNENKFPLDCSGDLDLSQIADAKLLLECDLCPGDLLYFPRGTVLIKLHAFS